MSVNSVEIQGEIQPVNVVVKNWADPIKPPYTKKTVVKTYILDPAGSGDGKFVQICVYEPQRMRVSINVIDVAVVLTMNQPVTSPDATTASTAPSGLYLPPSIACSNYDFFGPDAFWLNSLTAITRVTVVKEYC